MAGEAPISLPPAYMTPLRCCALAHIRLAKTPLSRAALTQCIGGSQSSTGSLLQGLRADHLIRKLDNGAQGYVVTPEGAAAVADYFRALASIEALWLAGNPKTPAPPRSNPQTKPPTAAPAAPAAPIEAHSRGISDRWS